MIGLRRYASDDEASDSALRRADAAGHWIGKYADPSEGARDHVPLDEAIQIAREDPGLIWVCCGDDAAHEDAAAQA